jgi:hypothetical protein
MTWKQRKEILCDAAAAVQALQDLGGGSVLISDRLCHEQENSTDRPPRFGDF